PTETLDLMGLEAAVVLGPFSLTGEYSLASIDGDTGSPNDPNFSGYYLQASYFLTGESRGYKKAQGCFGAWELAARISSLDLTDDGIDGGQLDDLSLGVNWYLNPNTRVMLDYIV